MDDFDAARTSLARSIADRHLVADRVVAAIGAVPRHRFVPADRVEDAYLDRPLPIGSGQTISQPTVVAMMADTLDVHEGDRVLEVGAGSGYAAAVLAALGARVWAVERHHALVDLARDNLATAGFASVEVVEGDGTLGHPPEAPYDAISVAAVGPAPPDALLDQLADGGRMVMPVGERRGDQHLVRITRDGERFVRVDLGAVRFVPLLGEQGF